MRKDFMAGAAFVIVAGCVAARVVRNIFDDAVGRSNEEVFGSPFSDTPLPVSYEAKSDAPALGIGA